MTNKAMSIIHTCQNQLLEMVNWILPPVCPVSGEIVPKHGMLAPSAWQGLSFITDPKCTICGIPFAYDHADDTATCAECLSNPKPYHRAASALLYNDTSRDLILKYKHGDKTQAVPIFLPLLLRAGRDVLNDADVLMPVPLHPMRLLKRRYNQSALLVAALSKVMHVPADCNGLRRVRHTAVQGHLDRKKRASNVKNAFTYCRKEGLYGQNIVLIDDVYTTGATVEACSKALLKAGAKQVNILTIARVSNL